MSICNYLGKGLRQNEPYMITEINEILCECGARYIIIRRISVECVIIIVKLCETMSALY